MRWTGAKCSRASSGCKCSTNCSLKTTSIDVRGDSWIAAIVQHELEVRRPPRLGRNLIGDFDDAHPADGRAHREGQRTGAGAELDVLGVAPQVGRQEGQQPLDQLRFGFGIALGREAWMVRDATEQLGVHAGQNGRSLGAVAGRLEPVGDLFFDLVVATQALGRTPLRAGLHVSAPGLWGGGLGIRGSRLPAQVREALTAPAGRTDGLRAACPPTPTTRRDPRTTSRRSARQGSSAPVVGKPARASARA